MIIANPIYDIVFKRMMENERVAKFFIGTLLEQNIEAVEVKPQEFTYTDDLAGLAIFRLDFIATIKTQSGELKKVLIEIQKAKNQIDLMRFRRYLGEQYKKEEQTGKRKTALPITTIYILGFKLHNVETPCMKVERNYKDMISNEIIHTKSDFIEKLTHDSFVVQVARITGRYQTRLDKLLSLFEQANFTDDQKITKEFTHTPDTEDMELTTGLLHYAGTNTETRKKIETEEEAWRTVYGNYGYKEGKLVNIIDELEKEIDEKEKEIDEKEKVIDEKEKEIDEKDRENKALREQLEALKRKLGGE